jgi:hypothetical protein
MDRPGSRSQPAPRGMGAPTRWARGLVLVVLAAFLASEPAWGCRCPSIFGPETVKRAAAVFMGKATTVEFLEPDEKANEPPILVTFDVSEIWKGPEGKSRRRNA